jgi:hypothetical protein
MHPDDDPTAAASSGPKSCETATGSPTAPTHQKSTDSTEDGSGAGSATSTESGVEKPAPFIDSPTKTVSFRGGHLLLMDPEKILPVYRAEILFGRMTLRPEVSQEFLNWCSLVESRQREFNKACDDAARAIKRLSESGALDPKALGRLKYLRRYHRRGMRKIRGRHTSR